MIAPMPPSPSQIEVEWKDAPRAILRTLPPPSGAAAARVVGITGPVGSGKSTLAARLGGAHVPTDHYLPDYHRLAEHERDEPRHADRELLALHLDRLRRGEPVEMPVWCFHAHARVGTRPVPSAPLVVCEGLFALDDLVLPLLDLAVFVEAPPVTRWARWERLERNGERGWGVERARAYFDAVAEPTFAKYAAEYRRRAHVIVRNPLDELEEGA